MVDIRNKLRQHGCRMTRQRHQIYSALTDSPQSVPEIVRRLRAGGKTVDTVTIYRTLDRLIALKLIEQTRLAGNGSRYERSSKPHHHHLVCEHCGGIADIALNEALLVHEIAKKTTFRIRRHHLEFFGLCAKCQ